MKKILLFLLVFIGIITAMAQPLNGKCGKNVNWILRNVGTLIVSGFGATYDFSKKPQNATFTKYGIAETIKTVDFTHFSGKINDNLFYSCKNLNTIVLSEKQQCTFSLNAFAGCMITKLELVPEKINKQNRCRYCSPPQKTDRLKVDKKYYFCNTKTERDEEVKTFRQREG